MNQQQPMMVGMNAGGGPVGGGPMPNHAMINAATGANTPGSQPQPPEPINTEILLNTYIYDYFLKNHAYDLARALHNEFPLEIRKNGGGKEVTTPMNGHIDGDNKEHKRPTDLPIPSIATAESDSAFLADWWGQFWDIFSAHRGKGKASPASLSYMGHTRDQQRARQANQRMMGQMDPNVMRNYGMNAMGPNGMMLNNNLQKRALANSQNGPNLQQMQMKMQQMGRDGNGMGMDGQRPQSPGSMENAPSPKRQRTDGNGFNGQPMGPLGRGQPMPGQPGQGGPMNQMMNGTQLTPEQFQQMQNNNPALQKQIEGITAGGVPQGASMGQQDASDLFGGRANVAAAGQNGNHALQDYQMQLMLLEQQNKRRLLMARQEQDNLTHAPPGPGQMGQPNQPPFGPNAMSPSGQRPGPSPNPNDQMKRGTPKMGPQNLPGSPMPDGGMPQNRNSPSANFDPSQIPQGMAPQQFYGQAGMRPPSSHPQFPQGMTQQQMEAMRQRMPNGQMWQGQPNGPPQMMPQGAQQGMPPNQQPGQMGNPRSAHMPPPPAPPASGPEQNRAAQQTSSPSQNSNAPPTPSQAPKAAPKGKKEANQNTKKKPAKKGGAGAPGATPASESQEAPTPTPSTPITPRHGSFQQQSNGTNQNPQAGSQAPNPGQNPAAQNAGPQMEGGQQPGFEGGLNGQDSNNMGGGMDSNGVNLDFAMGGDDVLDNFDFDSFLQPGGDEDNTMFDPNSFGIFDGVEAGGDMS